MASRRPKGRLSRRAETIASFGAHCQLAASARLRPGCRFCRHRRCLRSGGRGTGARTAARCRPSSLRRCWRRNWTGARKPNRACARTCSFPSSSRSYARAPPRWTREGPAPTRGEPVASVSSLPVSPGCLPAGDKRSTFMPVCRAGQPVSPSLESAWGPVVSALLRKRVRPRRYWAGG
jgi:hypothetical protein